MKAAGIRAVRWATPAVLLVEVTLVLSGRLSLGRAAAVLVAVEAALAMTVVAAHLVLYRGARSQGATRAGALKQAGEAALPAPLARFVVAEARLYASLWLWLRRRQHGVGTGDVPLPYAGQVRGLQLVLLGVSVAELVAVELLVPWPVVRLVLLVLGVWTLGFVLGMVAAVSVRPHVLSVDRLRLRSGASYEVVLPLSRARSASRRLRPAEKGWPYLDGSRLVIPQAGHTSVDLELDEPTTVPVGRRTADVTAVSFAVDDPAAAVASLAALRPG